MRASIVAFGLAGAAAASYAPPAYETPEAPAYPVTTPAVYPTPEAPVYPSSSEEHPPVYPTPSEEHPPVYPTSSEEHPPVYPTPSEEHPPVYETKTYTAITTYCPKPTVITYGPSTYSVTKETTLTLPPMTVTSYAPQKPKETPVPTYPVETHPAPPVYETQTFSTVAVPSSPASPVSPPKYPVGNNATAPATGSMPSASAPAQYTGSAAKVSAGVMGVFGLFAALFL